MRVWWAVAVCLVAGTISSSAEEFQQAPWVSARKCTTQDAKAADSDLDHLTSWAAVHRSFRRYKQCDDASIGEGYSDKIVILLTEHWPAITELSKLIQADPQFGDFVIWHVDELMSPKQGKIIIDNATNHCPNGLSALCRRLDAQARKPG
jgi:hypothetical protein